MLQIESNIICCAAAAVVTLLQYSLPKYYLKKYAVVLPDDLRYIQYTQTHISTEAYAILAVAAANRTDQSVECDNLNQLRLVQRSSSSS
jgi:hypothetical protein